MAAEAGLRPSIVTNGSRLTREMSAELVAAGIRSVSLSLGGYRKETYEAVHRGLSFERVYRNGLDFLEVAKGKAFLNIQISPMEDTVAEATDIAHFWRSQGAKFCFIFPFAASRGGAREGSDIEQAEYQEERLASIPGGCLNIEELFRPTRRDAQTMRSRAPFVCYAKDRNTFISWQGNYHLCCSDYEKQHPVGHVSEMSVEEAYAAKAQIAPSNNELCAQCDFSGGDLAPRDLRFYGRMGAYLVGSWMAAHGRRPVHPDLQ